MKSDKLIYLFLITFMAVLCAGYFSITHRSIDDYLDLDSPPVQTHPHSLHNKVTFRVAIANMQSPVASYLSYRDLADLLAQAYNLTAELIIRDSYSEINEMLDKSQIDLAFISSSGYAAASGSMDVIAAAVVDGRPEYHELIIVPKNSPANSVSDLKDKEFLFVDPEYNLGCVFTSMKLANSGEELDSFFRRYNWTNSNDRSIMAISQNMADGACVSSIIFNLMSRENPSLKGSVRVLDKYPAMPSPPVVVRKTMPFSYRKKLVGLLIGLKDTAQGREILDKLGIDGFIEAENSDYLMLHTLEGP